MSGMLWILVRWETAIRIAQGQSKRQLTELDQTLLAAAFSFLPASMLPGS